MRKFKHKKLGWLAIESNTGFIVTNPFEPASPNCLYFTLPAELIIGSPDWVEEKDFVITAFRKGERIRKILPNGRYKGDGEGALEFDIDELMGHEIFSVLCNGIEWKVDEYTNKGKIEKFEIIKDEMMVWNTAGGLINISELTPAKKVILTTEDGVEIYDPEQYISFVLNDFTRYMQKANFFDFEYVGKTFSTREAAQSYIDRKKPKHSDDDIREAYKDRLPGYIPEDLITKLNEK